MSSEKKNFKCIKPKKFQISNLELLSLLPRAREIALVTSKVLRQLKKNQTSLHFIPPKNATKCRNKFGCELKDKTLISQF